MVGCQVSYAATGAFRRHLFPLCRATELQSLRDDLSAAHQVITAVHSENQEFRDQKAVAEGEKAAAEARHRAELEEVITRRDEARAQLEQVIRR